MDFDFEKDLSINKFKLDEECISHAGLYFCYSEAAVEAKAKVDELSDMLKLVQAEQQIAIRKKLSDEGAKYTESVVSAELEKDASVQKVTEKLRKARENYARLNIAVTSFEQRKSMLDNLVKLFVSGYFGKPVGDERANDGINTQVSKEIKKNLNKGKGE